VASVDELESSEKVAKPAAAPTPVNPATAPASDELKNAKRAEAAGPVKETAILSTNVPEPATR